MQQIQVPGMDGPADLMISLSVGKGRQRAKSRNGSWDTIGRGDGQTVKADLSMQSARDKGMAWEHISPIEGTAERIDGITLEGDEHERAHEAICIADESD